MSQNFNQLIYDFRLPLFLLFCLGAQIISWRIWRVWIKNTLARHFITLVFIIMNLGWFFSVGTLYLGHDLTDFTWAWVGRPSFAWQLVHLVVIAPLALLWSVLMRAALKILRLFQKNAPDQKAASQSRRTFIKAMCAGGTTALVGTCAYGVWRQARPPVVEKINIDIAGLPLALDGFTVVQLSDVHLGLWASQQELDRAVALAAEAEPDLVVFTGDQVDRSPEYARLYHEPIKRLHRVPYGIWGVLGNHDHYTKDPQRVAEILTDGGLVTLMDEQINIPDLPLSIIGLDDPGLKSRWLSKARNRSRVVDQNPLDFSQVEGPAPRQDDFVILLNHRPDGFAQAAAHGCHLFLAGHTHGGQYQVPFREHLNLSALFYKYSSGLYHDHGAWIYVNRGLAAVGVPFRLFAWPELSLITLRRA